MPHWAWKVPICDRACEWLYIISILDESGNQKIFDISKCFTIFFGKSYFLTVMQNRVFCWYSQSLGVLNSLPRSRIREEWRKEPTGILSRSKRLRVHIWHSIVSVLGPVFSPPRILHSCGAMLRHSPPPSMFCEPVTRAYFERHSQRPTPLHSSAAPTEKFSKHETLDTKHCAVLWNRGFWHAMIFSLRKVRKI